MAEEAVIQEALPLTQISLGVDGYCRVADIQQRLGQRFPERIAPYSDKPASQAPDDPAEHARRQARHQGQMSQEKVQHLIRTVFVLINTTLQEKTARAFPIPAEEVPTLRALREISAEAVAHLVGQATELTAFFAEPDKSNRAIPSPSIPLEPGPNISSSWSTKIEGSRDVQPQPRSPSQRPDSCDWDTMEDTRAYVAWTPGIQKWLGEDHIGQIVLAGAFEGLGFVTVQTGDVTRDRHRPPQTGDVLDVGGRDGNPGSPRGSIPPTRTSMAARSSAGQGGFVDNYALPTCSSNFN